MTNILIDAQNNTRLVAILKWCNDKVGDYYLHNGLWDWDFQKFESGDTSNWGIVVKFKDKKHATMFALVWT